MASVRFKAAAFLLPTLSASAIAVAGGLPAFFRAQPHMSLEPRTFAAPSEHFVASNHLRVLSLNVAHGRANRRHQLLQSRSHRRATLSAIAKVVSREKPHVAALQELDGPSFWSGGFCHLEQLARLAGFVEGVHGEHVRGPFLRYGTALLSMHKLTESSAFTFDASPPTMAKGLTVAAVELDGRLIDVVSVHLDFWGNEVRMRQAIQMMSLLRTRTPPRPLVVMGDFNAQWHDERSAVRAIADALNLTAHHPHVSALSAATFPATGARLDWILISRELEFQRYEVLSEVVSDHLPVLAEVRFRRE